MKVSKANGEKEWLTKKLGVKVRPQEIAKVLKKTDEYHKDGQQVDWESAIFIVVSLYSRNPSKAFAISERMRCLAALTKDERIKHWSKPASESGVFWIHPALVSAAAHTKLYLIGDQVQFNADEFFELALKKAEPETTA